MRGLDVGNEGNWTIDNVSAEIRKFNVTGGVGTNNEKYSVGSATSVVPADFPASKVVVSESVSTSETSTTTTTHGFKIGAKFGSKQGIKTKVPFIAEGKVEISQEINGEYNFAKSYTEGKTKSNTRTITMETPASPGFATTLDVFTTKRDANYFYEADLSFGKDGVAQNVTTPATLALGQSPARRQPCLAYVVGDSSVRNSITYIGQQLFDAGYKANDSSLSSLQRGFLESIPGFKAEGRTCPGFPGGYPRWRASRAGVSAPTRATATTTKATRCRRWSAVFPPSAAPGEIFAFRHPPLPAGDRRGDRDR